MKNKLTDKQKAFIAEYLIDKNDTQAAIRAGYSKKTAYSIGQRLLKHVEVKKQIEAKLEELNNKALVTAEEIILEMKKIGFSDIGEIFNPDGSMKAIDQIPTDARRAIAGIEIDELYDGFGKDREQIGLTKKVKLWDKMGALVKLGEHLNLFKATDDNRLPIEINVNHYGTKKAEKGSNVTVQVHPQRLPATGI